MEARLEKESVLDVKGMEEESSTSESRKYNERHGKFRCKECNYESNIKSNIYPHERTKHRKSKESFKCKICNKNFSSAYSLKSHLESHVNPYVCEFCSKRLTTKNGLKMHINKTHLSTASYECPICKKLYHMKSSLEGHVNAHSNHKPFKCSTCHKSFSWKSSLYTHLLVIPNINRIVST